MIRNKAIHSNNHYADRWRGGWDKSAEQPGVSSQIRNKAIVNPGDARGVAAACDAPPSEPRARIYILMPPEPDKLVFYV